MEQVTSMQNITLQGVPIENCHKEMAVLLTRCTFDPMLLKPKCV